MIHDRRMDRAIDRTRADVPLTPIEVGLTAAVAILAAVRGREQAGGRGDWIDLSADKCTLLYTSEGTLIRRFNVCTNTQLTDFATLPAGACYALRIRANGEVMVAFRGLRCRRISCAQARTRHDRGASISDRPSKRARGLPGR